MLFDSMDNLVRPVHVALTLTLNLTLTLTLTLRDG
jgi:hypothetical protein